MASTLTRPQRASILSRIHNRIYAMRLCANLAKTVADADPMRAMDFDYQYAQHAAYAKHHINTLRGKHDKF